jgi:hypothetical protein
MRFLTLASTLWLSAFVHASPGASEIGGCQYYETLSTSMGCNDSGYLMHFGYKYCIKFFVEEPIFSPRGMRVLDQIRTCLQQKLEQAPGLTCSNVEDIAVDSHATCYEESGFCSLNLIEQGIIGTTILPSLVDPRVEATLEQVQQYCLTKDLADIPR